MQAWPACSHQIGSEMIESVQPEVKRAAFQAGSKRERDSNSILENTISSRPVLFYGDCTGKEEHTIAFNEQRSLVERVNYVFFT